MQNTHRVRLIPPHQSFSCNGWTRTNDLVVMGHKSYLCYTLRYNRYSNKLFNMKRLYWILTNFTISILHQCLPPNHQLIFYASSHLPYLFNINVQVVNCITMWTGQDSNLHGYCATHLCLLSPVTNMARCCRFWYPWKSLRLPLFLVSFSPDFPIGHFLPTSA